MLQSADLFVEFLSLEQERVFSLLKQGSINQLLDERVRKMGKFLVALSSLQLQRLQLRGLSGLPICIQQVDALGGDLHLFLAQFKGKKRTSHRVADDFFPDACCRTPFRMAAVIDVRFLDLADQREAAVPTRDQPPVEEFMPLGPRIELAGEDIVHAIKERLADQRFVRTREGLIRAFEADDADVEGVVEDLRYPVQTDPSTPSIAQTALVHLFRQPLKVVLSRRVEFERDPDQRRSRRIRFLHLAAALVQVPDRSPHRIEALFDPPVEALPRLLSKIADEVGGDHGLNVGGEDL